MNSGSFILVIDNNGVVEEIEFTGSLTQNGIDKGIIYGDCQSYPDCEEFHAFIGGFKASLEEILLLATTSVFGSSPVITSTPNPVLDGISGMSNLQINNSDGAVSMSYNFLGSSIGECGLQTINITGAGHDFGSIVEVESVEVINMGDVLANNSIYEVLITVLF